MSRDSVVMQYVLDLLTDGIYTTTTQQIGFSPHDEITEDKLPLVQAYLAVGENAEDDPRVTVGSTTFVVEIIDVKGKLADLSRAVDSLEREIRFDSSLKNEVEKAIVGSFVVRESGELERSLAQVTITAQYLDGILDPANDVEVLPFDFVTQFETDAPNELEQATFGFGSIGFKKVENTTSPQVRSLVGINPNLPVDLSGIKALRLLFYVDRENAGRADFSVLFGIDLALLSSITDANQYFNTVSRHGWNEILYDLENPDFVAGTPDMSNIGEIRFNMRYTFQPTFVSTTFGIVFRRLGYSLRDQGDNAGRGQHPGF